MEKQYVLQWESNKHLIEKWFNDLDTDFNIDYLDIVKVLFKEVLKPGRDGFYPEEFDVANITVVDNGDYQGTILFIIPYKTYQPQENDYVVTSVGYGSCSGCDTLQGIMYDGNSKEQNVKDLMSLALHFVQKTKTIY